MRSASAGDAAVQAGRRRRIFYGRRCGGGYQPENDTPSSACVWRDSHRIGRTAFEGVGADQGMGKTTDDVSGGSAPQKTEEKTGADTRPASRLVKSLKMAEKGHFRLDKESKKGYK